MSALEQRVTKLETKRDGNPRFIAVPIWEGESKQDAIEAAGIEPTDRDLVVFVTMYSKRKPDNVA